MAKGDKKQQTPTTLTAATLQSWCKRMGYSAHDACQELGCTPAQWAQWEQGTRGVPRYIGLACAALALGMSAYSDGEEGN